MAVPDVLTFLARQRQAASAAHDTARANAYTTFETLYDRRLWHQLTIELVNFVAGSPPATTDAFELMSLYTQFVADFEEKVNQFALAQIAIAVVRRQDPTAGREFLESLAGKVQSRLPEAYALVLVELAQFKLDAKDTEGSRKNLAEVQALLDKLPGVEPLLHSSFYRVSANADKVESNFVGYYKNALLYLACTPVATIPPADRTQRAHDLALAALLADSIYNFGDLLAHEILVSMQDSDRAWLVDLLRTMNRGDLDGFAQMKSHVDSVEAGARRVTFDAIAHHVRLPVDQVELLIMRAMSLGLLRGTLDQIDRVVDVSWVQPRVLDRGQIGALADRLRSWSNNVAQVVDSIRTTAPELLV